MAYLLVVDEEGEGSVHQKLSEIDDQSSASDEGQPQRPRIGTDVNALKEKIVHLGSSAVVE